MMNLRQPLAFVFSLDVTETLLFWKVIGASLVLLLAGFQVLLAARFWGVSGFPPVPGTLAAKLHRVNGRIAITVAITVAIVCIAGPAGTTTPTRVLLHSIFGTLAIVIMATKFTVLRVVRKGQRFLPYIGTGLFLAFGAIWLTSVADFVAAK